MGLLTTAGAFAPAALAEEPAATTTPTSEAPAPAEATPTGPVLTPTPTPAPTPTADTADTAAEANLLPAEHVGARYGTGKGDLGVGVTLAYAGDEPGGETVDGTGAEVTLTFTGGTGAGTSTTCTFTSTSCAFAPVPGLPTIDLPWGEFLSLPADSDFVLTLTKAPASGQLIADSSAVLYGYTSSDQTDPMPTHSWSSMTLSAPSGYRTLGVQLDGAPLAGSTFALCTIAGDDCSGEVVVPVEDAEMAAASTPGADHLVTALTNSAGLATFPGSYRPGSYTVTQTAAPAGFTFDPAPRQLLVGAAASVAQRGTVVPLHVTGPVSDQPTPTSSVPTSTAPAPTSTAAPTASTVAERTLAAGARQTVTLGGFQPGEMVHGVLHSTPVDLGTVQAGADGVATFTFLVPAGFEVGAHSVEMTGLTSGIVGEVSFVVTAATAGSGGLAYTGVEVVPLLALGGGLLVAGAGALTVAHRRRSA
jgi:hypothetical protein